jgi:hypothetical protein
MNSISSFYKKAVSDFETAFHFIKGNAFRYIAFFKSGPI